jgi:hypothetical protein
LLRRTLVVLAGLGFGLLADYFRAGYIAKGDLTNFLVVTGAMIGGTTAIVFSISLFLLQGVSDMYSSRHLEDYVNHWRDQLIFPTIILITLSFFASALYIASVTTLSSSLASIVIAVSLLLVGFVFGLIDLQYEAVRMKVSPARVLAFLRSKAQGFLRQIQRDANEIAQIVRFPVEGMTQSEALAVVYNGVLRTLIADLGIQIELIVDIALRLAERQEVEMTRQALVTISELLGGYVEARRTSSLAYSSPIAPFATESDSHAFLSARFEQLNRAGLTFIHAGQDDLAVQVIEVYRVVAKIAKDVKPLGITHENPILEWVMWSLNTYMRSGVSERNIDVVFHGTAVLQEIGIMATDLCLDNLVFAVQERLEEFGELSLGFSTTIVLNRAAAGLLAILDQAFHSELVNREFAVERSLKGVGAMLIALTAALAAKYLENNFATAEALRSTYTQLYTVVDDVLNHYTTLKDEGEKRAYRRDLVMLFDELRRHFREMAKYVNADSLTVESIGNLTFHLNEIIIALLQDDEFNDVDAGFRESLTRLCYSPYWFLGESIGFEAGANAVTTLADCVAKTGILAWRAGDKDVVKQCITALDDMANAALAKGSGSNGYAEPRILERACYLGILATVTPGWGDVVDDLKTRVHKFKVPYVKKYLENVKGLAEDFDPYHHGLAGLLQPHQVAVELLRWAGKFDYERLNGVRIMDDAEDMMYELTTEATIRAFVKGLWAIE